MFSIFRRSKIITTAPSSPSGFLQPAQGPDLLATPRRQKLLENIWQRASLSRLQFAELYLRPLERYAELVQQLPASENHHHAHPGGMLDHGLEIVAYALKIRQTYLLPIGAPPESQSAQAEAWTAAAAYGALIHDLGKVAVDVHIELQGGRTWHPWHGSITSPYRFRYVKGRNYQLHGAAAALIYAHVITPDILDWLSGFPEVWEQLLFVLAGQYENAGILGEIVVKADQASVAQELGGNPARALAAPKQSLQRQLADGLRHLVRDKFKLNQADGPSDGWLAQDALWLVSKPIADQLPTSRDPVIAVPDEPALIPLIPETSLAPRVVEVVEAIEINNVLLLPPQLESTPDSKLLTQVESISSDRYSLEHAILPVGTGLSHELTWDGPGTWWEDLGIPQPSSQDEGPGHSILFTLMLSGTRVKNYSWG